MQNNNFIEIPKQWINNNYNYSVYQVQDNAMQGKGIINGACLLVQQNTDIKNNDIGLFKYKGDFIIREYKELKDNNVMLKSYDIADNTIIDNKNNIEVLGIALKSILDLDKK